MEDMKLAKWLNGTESKGKDPGRVRYYYGTAVEDSADGKVKIRTDGTMITQDNQDYVELNCYGHVSEGDVVRISSVNGIPAAEDGVGWGDKMHVDITLHGNAIDALEENVATIETDVDEAAKVATNYMHFDEEELGGLTIGNMTDETLGNNVNINATGIDVRENATTIVARFAASLIELGRNKLSAVIEMCKGALRISAQKENISGIDGTSATLSVNDGSNTARTTMLSANGYSESYIGSNGETALVNAYDKTETSSSSANYQNHSQWGANGTNYVRSDSNVNGMSNASQSNSELRASHQVGSGGTVFSAGLTVSASASNGGRVAATIQGSSDSAAKIVYLMPVYRLRNPNGFYLFTTSASERTQLIGYGWGDEGIGFYAFN